MARCVCNSLFYVTLPFLILIPVGLFICYGVALMNEHIDEVPSWPNIAEVGNDSPESSLFTLFLFWGAFSLLLTSGLFFKYMSDFRTTTICNPLALFVACVVAFGFSLMASFQAMNSVPSVYYAGLILIYVGSIVYSWIVVYISWMHLSGKLYDKGIVIWRTFIAIAETALGFMYIAALIVTNQEDIEEDDIIDPNFASITSWCLLYTICIFYGSLMYDFCHIRKARTQLILHDLDLGRPLDEIRIIDREFAPEVRSSSRANAMV